MPGRNEERPPKWARELSAGMQLILRQMAEDRRRADEERRKSDARFEYWMRRMDAHLEQAARDREDFKQDRRNFSKLMGMVFKMGRRMIGLLEDIGRGVDKLLNRRTGLQGDGP